MIIELKNTCSTNDYLLSQINTKELAEGTTVIATNQTKGKGQQNNIWFSEPGKNLTFSILLKPVSIDAENMFMISKAVSLGIVKYLNSLGKEFTIKWPNDIYYRDKKICGILIENRLLGAQLSHSVIGIGLNVNQTNWPIELPNAVSLKTIFANEFDLSICLKGIYESIMVWYNILLESDYNMIENEYYKNIYRKVGFHRYLANNIEFEAEIVNVSPDGNITLRKNDGSKEGFYFKEVEFI